VLVRAYDCAALGVRLLMLSGSGWTPNPDRPGKNLGSRPG